MTGHSPAETSVLGTHDAELAGLPTINDLPCDSASEQAKCYVQECGCIVDLWIECAKESAKSLNCGDDFNELLTGNKVDLSNPAELYAGLKSLPMASLVNSGLSYLQRTFTTDTLWTTSVWVLAVQEIVNATDIAGRREAWHVFRSLICAMRALWPSPRQEVGVDVPRPSTSALPGPRNSFERDALHRAVLIAISHGSVEVIVLFSLAFEWIPPITSAQTTPLMHAAAQGNETILHILLVHCLTYNPKTVASFDHDGRNALMHACINGSVGCVRILLSAPTQQQLDHSPYAGPLIDPSARAPPTIVHFHNMYEVEGWKTHVHVVQWLKRKAFDCGEAYPLENYWQFKFSNTGRFFEHVNHKSLPRERKCWGPTALIDALNFANESVRRKSTHPSDPEIESKILAARDIVRLLCRCGYAKISSDVDNLGRTALFYLPRGDTDIEEDIREEVVCSMDSAAISGKRGKMEYCHDSVPPLIHQAVLTGSVPILNSVVKKVRSARNEDANGGLEIRDHYLHGGWTPVMVASSAFNLMSTDDNHSERAFCGPNGDASLRLVKVLVEAGADICASDTFGRTALHISAQCGNSAVVKYLLQKGIDVDVSFPQTPLRLSVQYGHVITTKYLLEKGARPDTCTLPDDYRSPQPRGEGKYSWVMVKKLSPLMLAVSGEYDEIGAILAAICNLNTVLASGGGSCLSIAMEKGMVKTVRSMLARTDCILHIFATVLFPKNRISLVQENTDTACTVTTVLHLAAHMGWTEELQNALVLHSASILESSPTEENCKDQIWVPNMPSYNDMVMKQISAMEDAKSGNLHEGSGFFSTDFEAFLVPMHKKVVSNHDPFEIWHPTRYSNEATHVRDRMTSCLRGYYAKLAGGHDIVTPAGVCSQLWDYKSRTPLYYAARADNVACVEVLLKNGVIEPLPYIDGHIATLRNRNSLCVAAGRGHLEAVRLLVLAYFQRGDPSVRKDSIDLALACAALGGHGTALSWILESVENKEHASWAVLRKYPGESSLLHVACKNCPPHVILKLLEQADAFDFDVSLYDGSYQTLFHAISCNGHLEKGDWEPVLAKLSEMTMTNYITDHDIWGYTPLAYAAGSARLPFIEFVFKTGVEIHEDVSMENAFPPLAYIPVPKRAVVYELGVKYGRIGRGSAEDTSTILDLPDHAFPVPKRLVPPTPFLFAAGEGGWLIPSIPFSHMRYEEETYNQRVLLTELKRDWFLLLTKTKHFFPLDRNQVAVFPTSIVAYTFHAQDMYMARVRPAISLPTYSETHTTEPMHAHFHSLLTEGHLSDLDLVVEYDATVIPAHWFVLEPALKSQNKIETRNNRYIIRVNATTQYELEVLQNVLLWHLYTGSTTFKPETVAHPEFSVVLPKLMENMDLRADLMDINPIQLIWFEDSERQLAWMKALEKDADAPIHWKSDECGGPSRLPGSDILLCPSGGDTTSAQWAHRSVLIVRCRALFEGTLVKGFRESCAQTYEIPVLATKGGVTAFLQYCYFGEKVTCKYNLFRLLDADILTELLVFADMFLLDELKDICEWTIMGHLDCPDGETDYQSLLELGVHHGMPRLKEGVLSHLIAKKSVREGIDLESMSCGAREALQRAMGRHYQSVLAM